MASFCFLPAVQSADPLFISPGEIELDARCGRQQLLVSAVLADGFQSDLTREATYESLNPSVAEVSSTGLVVPRSDGATHIVARTDSGRVAVPVIVSEMNKATETSFFSEVIPALSRGGCSQGACHGSPQGKNGFRLSLRGFDPTLDVATLTREGAARRINRIAPVDSLLLEKATGRIGHGGGRRFDEQETAYHTLLDWIAEGCPVESSPAKLTRLDVTPATARLRDPHDRQQLLVTATFDDGSRRDVTELAVFTTASKQNVTVSPSGLVVFRQTSEAAILVRYLDQIETVRLSYVDRDANYQSAQRTPATYVDKHVFAKHKALQLQAAEVVDDATFLRRVYLDLIGSIPTPQEASDFLDSRDPDKRRRLIDELLDRHEYALFWALKWADVMRGNSETITNRGVHNFHRYLVRNFADDRPFDKVAHEIVTSRGNTIHVPAANFYRISRNPTDAAESFSQLFLGVRIQCAKCHNHPYESISQRDYYGLAATFAKVGLKGQRFGRDDEVVYLADSGEVKMPGSSENLPPVAFGIALSPNDGIEEDSRRLLANWLTSAENLYFARSTVNRIWFHLMGQGLVDPIDDFRTSNPPSNPELLDALAREFVDGGYRMKPVIRSILNSATYQLHAGQVEQSDNAADDQTYFVRSVVRMLSAEQILDAISSATGVEESFPGYPAGTKAIAIAEGGIEHHFLQAFTKPVRDVACDCARESEPNLNQVVHLINNPGILNKVESGEGSIAGWIAAGKSGPELIELVYLATVSRRPTRDETQFAMGYLAASQSQTEGMQDLQHALINSNEFLLRH
jgi:hypothetical protein